MAMKFLRDRDKVFENWLNPVLSGTTIYNQGGAILPPGSVKQTNLAYNEPLPPSITGQPCGNNIEQPAWLSNTDDTLVMNGDVLSIGAYYLNGVPLSSWSAQVGGSQAAYQKKNMMQNWYYMNALTQFLFPKGLKSFLNKDAIQSYEISKLTIMEMTPCNNGIGLNIFVRFMLNDAEIWGKFLGVGIELKPKFLCQEIENLSVENKIKITGKLWNFIAAWFKAEPGIYKCRAKEVLVFSELGQLKKISEGSVVEVLQSDDDRIKLRYNDITYFVKKPTYYWFNWYFEKK